MENIPATGRIGGLLKLRPDEAQAQRKPHFRMPPKRSRIVVHETIYFQSLGEQVTVPATSRYERSLETTDEQPYQRVKVKLSPEWTPLDCGWLEGKSALVHVVNEEGKFTQTQPSKEQVTDAARRTVEVGIQVGDSVVQIACVPVLESMRWQPADAAIVRLRSAEGARVTVTVFPR